MKLTPLPRWIVWLCCCLLIQAMASSCVPRKKLLYLQDTGQFAQGQATKVPKSKFDYQLRPGDVILLRVFSLTAAEYNFLAVSEDGSPTDFLIDEDGNVELPAVGKFSVIDMTLAEAEQAIKNALKDFLTEPVVQLKLATPFEFTVLGEVLLQGKQSLNAIQVNILEAVASAGGLTDFADRAHIKIVRTNKAGKRDIIEVDVLDKRLLNDDKYFIEPEDIIIVEPLRAKTIRENQVFVLSSAVGIFVGLGFLIFQLLQ